MIWSYEIFWQLLTCYFWIRKPSAHIFLQFVPKITIQGKKPILVILQYFVVTGAHEMMEIDFHPNKATGPKLHVIVRERGQNEPDFDHSVVFCHYRDH